MTENLSPSDSFSLHANQSLASYRQHLIQGDFFKASRFSEPSLKKAALALEAFLKASGILIAKERSPFILFHIFSMFPEATESS